MSMVIYCFFIVSDGLNSGWFCFYMPDPVLSAWMKEDDHLKKVYLKKIDPVEPKRNPDYPTKVQVALRLLTRI
jgi:hypothetical protein